MANDQSATVKVALPTGSGRAVYHIKPNDTIDLRGLDLKNTRIDLLGADMVLTNTKTHATVVLAQLALYLFSKDDAPTIVAENGGELSPEAMLSHVGKVWEFTARDYLGITSLEKTDKDPNASEEGGKSLSDKVQSAEAAAAVIQPASGQFAAQVEPKPLNEDSKKFDHLLDMPTVQSNGQFSIPPKVSSDKVDVGPDEVKGAGNGLTFTFDARMLQTGVLKTSISPSTDEIRGGGAFETGVFDDRNSAQYSQEIIDVTAGSKSNYTIYADNPTYFTDTTAARTMELTPYMPDGFIPSQILVKGLPVGFSIIGATSTADGWLLTNPVLNSSGTILLPIVYPTANPTTFSLEINFTATFDASRGTTKPATGEISYTIDRDVEVKTVNTPVDGNYTDAQGHLVWVLAQNENSTKILAGDKTVTVYGGKGVDEVTSGAGNDTVYGGKGNDIISTGGGDDFLQGGDGNDTLIGGIGIDTADYTDKTLGVAIDLAALTNGAATAYVNGVAEDTLEGIENLNGGTGADVFSGDDGANVFNGGGGNDIFMGRGGNDTINGGAGNDTVSYDYASNGVTVALSGGAATVNVAAGDVDTLTGIENIIGTNFADTLTGDANANVITGGGGNDTINFSGGADVIDGGGATDTLVLTGSSAAVTLDLSTVNGSGYSTLTNGTDTQLVKGIENITGSAFSDTLTGTNGDNILIGAAGFDVLNGLGGNDTLYGGDDGDTLNGGDGDDTLYGGNGMDMINGGNGIDTGRLDDLTTGQTLTINSASSAFTASGDTFNDVEIYYMTNQADTVNESSAADTVYGLGGDDLFMMASGDSANDYFDGGNGTNTVNYSGASSAINLNLATQTATGNGTDTLINFQNAIGTSLDDTMQGSAVANTLDGGGGNNTVTYAYATTNLTANLASVDGSGYATVTVTGADVDKIKNFKTVIGGSGADTFTGNGTGNIFTGNAGNDTFMASAGSDTFNGGADVDTVNWGIMANAITATLDVNGNATATFAGLGKTDTLTGIENMTGGSANDALTGNASANLIRGGGGDDTINGMDGNDTLYGDAGNDTIHGGNNDDQIYGGDGNDTLYGDAGDDTFFGDLGNDTIDGGTGTNTMDYSAIGSAITVDMRSATGSATGTAIGTDSLTNIGRINTGGGGDIFYGSSGSDTFNAGGGIDLVYGSNGNDTLTNFEQADYSGYSAKITANLATGVILKDTNNDGTTDFTDNAGTTLTTIYTGSYNDTVTGSNAANTIATGDGNDTIIASRGSDGINGGNGTDTLNYTGLGGTINANLVLNVISKSVDSSTDSISSIEKIYGGTGADTFQISSGMLSSYTTLDGGSGTDTIQMTSGLIASNVEAVNFANVFDNMEVMDLRGATLNGGDSFQMTTTDIIGLTGTARTLDVYMNSGFNLALSTSSGYTLASDTSSGNTRTVTYSKSGETNVTLHVLTYS